MTSHTSLPLAAPASHGLPPAALERLIDTLEGLRAPGDAPDAPHEVASLDPHALAIAHQGTLLAEWSWAPYRTDHAALVYSASKTFTSLAIGFCEAEGLLSLDDDPGAILALANPHGLTLRHLLTMSTGHEQATIDALTPRVEALLSAPPEHAPGTHFAYNSPATHVLARVVEALTGEEVTTYLRPRLLDPLGIGPRWMARIDGHEQGFSGFHLTVEDLLRTGIMLADGGRFGGVQVAPAAYVEEMQRPWVPTAAPDAAPRTDALPDTTVDDWALGYGFQVWRSRVGFRLDGAWGQFCVVVPERGIVIAYQGATTDTARTLRAFWELLEEWKDEPVTEDPDDAARLAARTARLDSWSARERYAGAGLDVPGHETWTVHEDRSPGADGWVVETPDVPRIPVGDGAWRRSVSDMPEREGLFADPAERFLPLAARGEREDDGTLRAHVVATASPHRIILTVRPDGTLEAQWHSVPLRSPDLAGLAVPEVVVDPAR